MASKRKVKFAESVEDDTPSRKPRLDEDDSEDTDEDDTEKYSFLAADEFDGEEEGVARQENSIKITPFNMNEELEEGHFDKDGTYIFRNNVEAVKDWWLDNIDSAPLADKHEVPEHSDSEEEDFNFKENYGQILSFMNPNETVTKAIQRLGKSSKSSNKSKPKEKNPKEVNDREKLLQLIEFADRVLQKGDTDIYEKTYEQLQYSSSVGTSGS